MSKFDKKTAGLRRNNFKRHRQWAVDNLDAEHGYADKLKKQAKSKNRDEAHAAKDALAYMSQFNREYYDISGLNDGDAIHDTNELKQSCKDLRNAADKDSFSIQNRALVYDNDYAGQFTEALELPEKDHNIPREYKAQPVKKFSPEEIKQLEIKMKLRKE